ncbi:hypothetical protein Hypma_015179 [Hypsizygus marmoreus]|uniref:Uncharacterized protein n=1 Tax=Hypsizygus marmoreus TaxID=39966 RepID=A0A369K191_HYPMA|nr:hypothetical protein Hypma_015179 [Hypsizygus marmoreus]
MLFSRSVAIISLLFIAAVSGVPVRHFIIIVSYATKLSGMSCSFRQVAEWGSKDWRSVGPEVEARGSGLAIEVDSRGAPGSHDWKRGPPARDWKRGPPNRDWKRGAPGSHDWKRVVDAEDA